MPAEALTEEQLEPYRPIRIWRALDAGRRLAAAEAFWSSELVKDIDKLAAVEVLASAMHFRHQTIRSAPPARRAGFLAGCNALNDPVAGTLMYVYHMERQVPLMSKFLDALGIKHENGRIESDELEPPAGKSLAAAVESVLASCDRDDVLLYLRVLVSQDEVTWAALVPVIDKLSA